MNTAFQIYMMIAMAITTVCAVVAAAYWIDDVIVGRKKHNRLRGEIWSALRDTAHVYGEQGVIPSEVMLKVLHSLYDGEFIDWRQIKMDKEDMEWSVKSAEPVAAKEREACAQICDARAEKIEQAANDAALKGEREEISSLRATAWQLSVCAAAIRARGEIK